MTIDLLKVSASGVPDSRFLTLQRIGPHLGLDLVDQRLGGQHDHDVALVARVQRALDHVAGDEGLAAGGGGADGGGGAWGLDVTGVQVEDRVGVRVIGLGL